MGIIEGSTAALFVQDDPTEAFDVLTCVGIENITIPRGDVTVMYSPGAVSGQYQSDGVIVGEAGAATLPLTRPLESVYNWLLEAACPATYRVNWACSGTPRNLVTNYQVAMFLMDGVFTESAIESAAALQPDENGRVNTTGQISAASAFVLYKLTGNRLSLSATYNINGIDFLSRTCAGDCTAAIRLGEYGYVVMDSDYTHPSNPIVYYTDDSGANWTGTSANPFTQATRDATDVKTVITASGHRVIVSGGAVTGQPAVISYSDNEGTSWTEVTVHSTTGISINRLGWDTRMRLYAVASGGRVYRSADVGNSWVVLTNGTVTAQNLWDIAFYSDRTGYAVGDSNAVIRTTDGGSTWSALTGPAGGVNLLTAAVNRYGHVFVGANNGAVYRSVDQGTTWETIADFGSGNVAQIRFDPQNRYVGYLVYNVSGSATVYRTEDGGSTWLASEIGMRTPANAGIYALAVCDANLMYAAGDVSVTSYVAKFNRQAR